MLDIFDDVPLTPFITHPSAAIGKRYAGKKKHVGLHPNFLPGSTHGDNFESVISHVKALWPSAEGFRSHAFFDNSLVSSQLYQAGMRYDSNICLNMQPSIVPLQHESGLARFPVFLEDDVFMRSGPYSGKLPIKALKSPGLKIFNFHPIHVYLNTPSIEYYRTSSKPYGGRGTKDLLMDLIKFVDGRGIYLRDAYHATL